MKLFFLLIIIMTGVVTVNDTTAKEETQSKNDYYKALFKDQYKNPVVSVSQSSIPQIKICSVYDKSWENEDPLIPALYLLTDDGKKFQASTHEIPKLLALVKFEPLTENDARNAMLLYFEISKELRLIEDTTEPGLKEILPPAELGKIQKISLEKKGTVYEINCFGLSSNRREILFRQKPVLYKLEQLKFMIGKDIYKVERKTLWASKKKESKVEKLD